MKVKKLFKEWQNYLKKYTHVLPFSVTHYQDIALTLSIIHYANLTSSSTQKKTDDFIFIPRRTRIRRLFDSIRMPIASTKCGSSFCL